MAALPITTLVGIVGVLAAVKSANVTTVMIAIAMSPSARVLLSVFVHFALSAVVCAAAAGV